MMYLEESMMYPVAHVVAKMTVGRGATQDHPSRFGGSSPHAVPHTTLAAV